ncbi:tetratricopeptide repeat-containing sensor histidine kinase [Mangrovimonas spongiae]|uniref:Tetratricopeptide repeat protein n=1 Tax=Mangrovimonas spongiae TaxID=2494697 RepID=A0A3R9MCV6_9FLAO|nr:tetratricopeptide repeat protein [Mangrovimonas spongiae]RSK39049.1 tetratricopeptide repeat protein [Mangrovimonas spongiae]
MKLPKFIAFSFFYILVSTVSYGQSLSDSLSYYYNVVKTSKNNDQLVKAYEFYRAYVNHSEEQNQAQHTVYGYINLAIIQNRLGALNDSEHSAVQALQLLEGKQGDWVNADKLRLYNHLGRVYKALNNPKIALEYYNKALEVDTFVIGRNIIKNNIGTIYIKQKRYKEARQILHVAYQESLNLDNPKNKARILGNLGEALSKLNDTTAITKLKLSLGLRQQLNDKPGVFTAYNHLLKHYVHHNEIALAKTYLDTMLQMAHQSQKTVYLKEALSWYVKLNNDSLVTQYGQLLDSIRATQLAAENKYIARKYAYERQKRIAKQQELIAERQKRLKTIYQAVGGIIVVVAIAILLVYREKHKKDTLKNIYQTETNIAKRVHDEVANDVYKLMATIQKNPNNDVLDNLEAMYFKTRDISKDLGDINVDNNFIQTLEDLIVSFQTAQVTILVKGLSAMSWEALANYKKITLYRVLQELLVNMRKHSQATLVVLNFTQQGKKTKITYTDNGVGGKIEAGSGLQNAENRIKNCNGTFTFDIMPSKGFKAEITI